jgi:hypothetical protein
MDGLLAKVERIKELKTLENQLTNRVYGMDNNKHTIIK